MAKIDKVIKEEDGNLEDIRIPSDAFYFGVFEGKARYIRFDLNAFAEMEHFYGSMDDANAALKKGSMIEIRRILWLGLIWDEAVLDEITGEPIRYKINAYQVGRWLTANNMQSVIEQLMKSINGSLPQAEEITPEVVLNTSATEAAGKDPNS
jgi:hypothetical protein